MKTWLKGGLIGAVIYVVLYVLFYFSLNLQAAFLFTSFPFGLLFYIILAMILFTILFPLTLGADSSAFFNNWSIPLMNEFTIYLIYAIFNGFIIGSIIGFIITKIKSKKQQPIQNM